MWNVITVKLLLMVCFRSVENLNFVEIWKLKVSPLLGLGRGKKLPQNVLYFAGGGYYMADYFLCLTDQCYLNSLYLHRLRCCISLMSVISRDS